jgi:hypothetical protein
LETATQRGVAIEIRLQNLILGLFRDLPIIGRHEGGISGSYQLTDFQPYGQLSRTILFRENVLFDKIIPNERLRASAAGGRGEVFIGLGRHGRVDCSLNRGGFGGG